MPRHPETPPDPVDIAVGARLRGLRKQAGMSQMELAAAIGLSYQQVQKYERGRNRVSASVLTRAAQALGISASDLFDDRDDGDTRGLRELMTYAAEPGVLELIRCYTSIQSVRRRHSLMQIARVLAAEE